MSNNQNVRIPPITSLKAAIELYYSRTELGNADIEQLFGNSLPRQLQNLNTRQGRKWLS